MNWLIIAVTLLSSLPSTSSFNFGFFNHWHCIGITKNIDFSTPYRFNIGELPLVLWKDDENYLSTINICRHLGSTLDQGKILNGSLLCPYHGLKHDKKQSYGEIIDYQGRLWWSHNPVKQLPHSIPFYNKKGYVSQHLQIDMNAGLKDCAYNSMDLHHPEFVHKGLLGFGSSIPPSNVRTIHYNDRIGLEFDYHIKSNIRVISSEMNMTRRVKYTKNFNMFINPTIAWSKVSVDNGEKNLIIYVSMLPLKKDTTRWFVSVHHNFNKNNALQRYILKTATRLILNQDYKQFNKMYPNNDIKDVSTFHFMLKHDKPIEGIKELLQNYAYPDVKLCADFIKMTIKN